MHFDSDTNGHRSAKNNETVFSNRQLLVDIDFVVSIVVVRKTDQIGRYF